MIFTNAFETLNGINVKDKVKQKNRMTYLPWASAWGELKKLFPESYYTIYENRDGLNYHTDGKTCWVKTGVTLVWYDEKDERKELEHIEYLPVMDMRNQSIPLNSVTSFAVNKSIQRSLVKACARHGLGLYIFAGEDLPEDDPSYPRQVKRGTPQMQTSEPEKRSPEAEVIYQAVDKAIKEKTAGMTAEQKKAFASELKSVCGTVNYKVIADEAVLRKLYSRYVKKE